MSEKIVIHEVGPRDGLQVEQRVVPSEQKLAWLRRLITSGVDVIQVGSFVHPKRMPQMADTDGLFAELVGGGHDDGHDDGHDGGHDDGHERATTTTSKPTPTRPVLSGLALNEKGLDRALACGVEMICLGVSASETHSRKNTGMTTAEAQERIIATAQRAEAAGKRVQVSVQSAFGCGFEGRIPEERVLDIVRAYLAAGLRRVSLADTAGHAHPAQVRSLFGAMRALDPEIECACHFHDTYGLGMANVMTAMEAGVTSFETSFGGLGGCPFTKVAAGNVASEDLVHSLHRAGRRRDIDLTELVAVAQSVAEFFDRELPGRVYRTGTLDY